MSVQRWEQTSKKTPDRRRKTVSVSTQTSRALRSSGMPRSSFGGVFVYGLDFKGRTYGARLVRVLPLGACGVIEPRRRDAFGSIIPHAPSTVQYT